MSVAVRQGSNHKETNSGCSFLPVSPAHARSFNARNWPSKKENTMLAYSAQEQHLNEHHHPALLDTGLSQGFRGISWSPIRAGGCRSISPKRYIRFLARSMIGHRPNVDGGKAKHLAAQTFVVVSILWVRRYLLLFWERKRGRYGTVNRKDCTPPDVVCMGFGWLRSAFGGAVGLFAKQSPILRAGRSTELLVPEGDKM